MRMDETVVVRGDGDMIQFRQGRQLAAHGEAAHARAVELQDLDGPLLEQCTAAVRIRFALAGR